MTSAIETLYTASRNTPRKAIEPCTPAGLCTARIERPNGNIQSQAWNERSWTRLRRAIVRPLHPHPRPKFQICHTQQATVIKPSP